MTDKIFVSDEGNFDFEARVDDNGRVWLSPSIGWQDGEVYEWLRHGQRLCSIADKAQEGKE
jgi:hypothetical protein